MLDKIGVSGRLINKLLQASTQSERNIGRLASGLRISEAADDASGLGLTERLRSLARSIDQAGRNSLDAVGLTQTAEGGLDESVTVVTRMRELAVQSANETLSDEDRATIETEYQALNAELDRISSETEFNGINPLDGSASTTSVQVGAEKGDTFEIELTDSSSSGLGTAETSIASAAEAADSIDQLDQALDQISSARGEFGAAQTLLQSNYRSLQVTSENLLATESRIRDADIAFETSRRANLDIIGNAGAAVLLQANIASARADSLLS